MLSKSKIYCHHTILDNLCAVCCVHIFSTEHLHQLISSVLYKLCAKKTKHSLTKICRVYSKKNANKSRNSASVKMSISYIALCRLVYLKLSTWTKWYMHKIHWFIMSISNSGRTYSNWHKKEKTTCSLLLLCKRHSSFK